MKQYQAGYILDSIISIISNEFENESIFIDSERNSNEINSLKGLLNFYTTFDVNFPNHNNAGGNQEINPILAVLNNILTRGLPTKAPILIEEKFVEIGLIEPNSDLTDFNYTKSKKEFSYSTIFELLHVIEPNLSIIRENYGGSLGSHLEWQFIKRNPFLIQILQSQRDFSTISSHMVGGRTVDFSFTSPYLHWNNVKSTFENKTRIFEVDGPHHLLNEYLYYDHTRDLDAKELDVETYRFNIQEVQKNEVKFEKLIENNIYKIFEKNFSRKIINYLEEYTLLFVPIAVARIQKTLLEYLIANPNSFEKETLCIAIIERDIPGAALAIKILEEYFLNINAILEDKDKLNLPKIELSIFQDEKWIYDQRINCGFEVHNETFFGTYDFDIIIDHSVLKRSNIYKENNYTLRESIIIRSCHFVDNNSHNSRKAYCSKLLNYKALVNRNEDGSYTPIAELEPPINFFIQNIFRKKRFREGQLPIISRALQQKPVIGLLPTGGGKSLAFQLPAFLQPGLCLVVDPIKSLMEDQVRVLKENWIDCCDFINSTITAEQKRKKIIDFRLGETMFLFVSPERFVMEDFRNVISNISSSNLGLGFSYCVIDEVHCVSEWGHDFRYSYLMLGINAQKFCYTRDKKKKVSLIGLTATASFDVLTDIERELQIEHDDVANAIIMIENTIRPELYFKVIDVTSKNRIKILNEELNNLNKGLYEINTRKFLEESQKHHFFEFEPKDFGLVKNSNDNNIITNGEYIYQYNETFLLEDIEKLNADDFFTITFCPVRGTKQNIEGQYINQNGVRYVHDNLKSTSKGFYYASDSDEESLEVQSYFKAFTTGKLHQMVCTKAFGMGIDKSDIRSTFHYNYSSSLESFIQECGRAGRDKKIAIAHILMDTSLEYYFDVLPFFNDFKKLNSFERNCIRRNLESTWKENQKIDITFKSKENFNDFIENTRFGFTTSDGREVNIAEDKTQAIKKQILEKHGNYLLEKYKDRGVHDYFFKLSFKGLDYEKEQLYHLIQEPEFKPETLGFGQQPTLRRIFLESKNGTFNFTISHRKVYGIEEIKKMFFINHGNQDQAISNVIAYASSFEDFIYKLDEFRIRELQHISEDNKIALKRIFYRDRHQGDTGKMIYRLHSIGFLEDYTYDYNKKIYKCTFRKYATIQSYVDIIEKYLRRYLSENSALASIKSLASRLSFNNQQLIDDIIESLYFIAEFSYNEVVDKRKRATDEIEHTLLKMIALTGNDFQKNCFLKEEIYFYFNAKYARPGFKSNGEDCSLLDDHKKYLLNDFEPSLLLQKYLKDDILKSGTEQNNYKHLIGSCKKIMQSLSETDLKKEWVLPLTKAFAMYATNNESYRSEANKELEVGFINLFEDKKYFNGNYNNIKTVFDNYFESLNNNVQEENESFQDIALIKNKLLQQLQFKGIEDLLNKFNSLTNVTI